MFKRVHQVFRHSSGWTRSSSGVSVNRSAAFPVRLAGEGENRPRLYRWLSILIVALVALVVILAVAWVLLQWSIAEHVYSLKVGLDWFGITFYHDYTFIAAALFALLLVYPSQGGSDLWRLGTVAYRLTRPYEAEENRLSERMNVWLWRLWQVVKWAMGFYLFVVYGGFLFLGPIMNPIMMMSMGLGSWGSVPAVFALPLTSATGSGFISLMPTLSVQYAVISYVLSAVLLVVAIRVVLRMLTNIAIRRGDVPARNFLTLIALILLEVIIGAPYWLMNVATPYVYGVVWSAFLLSTVGIFYLYRRRAETPRFGLLKGAAVVLAILLVVQVGIGAFYFFNWNNNYLPYQWYPQTDKQITVTRWAAGLDGIHIENITNLPTSNPTTTLNLVRQWDQQAASVINTKEIGAYNWMQLASSEIVFYNGTE